MRNRYDGWALITGGSSGIGRCFANELSAQKINSIIVSDQENELEETAKDLRDRCGVEVATCFVDLASENFLDEIRRKVASRPISLLISNASFGLVNDFLTHPLREYDSLIKVNVRAYVALTHEYLPQMVERNAGGLIFVSSINAFQPIAKSAVYTASKAFEMYLGAALWYELRNTNIDVLVVMPGPTKTGFQKRAGTKLAPWAMQPEEVAQGALSALGKELLFIPGFENQLLAAVNNQLSMENRVAVASGILEAALIRGEDPNRET